MDIHPGETKYDDAVRLLEEHERRGEGKLTILDSGILRWRTVGNKNVYVYPSEKGLVSKVEVDMRPSATHLDDIIVLYGEPANLDIGKIRDGYFAVTFFYPDRGLVVVANGDKFDDDEVVGIGFVLEPEMVVSLVYFVQPSDIGPMVELLYGSNAVSQTLIEIQDWQGYRTYRE